MKKAVFSRRAFFNSLTDTASNSIIFLSMPAILVACREAHRMRLAGEDLQVFTKEEAYEFDAIAARIIPTTETAGAREAGVVYFMDNVLGDKREDELAVLKEGLRKLQTTSVLEYNSAYFYLLDEAQQDQLITGITNTPFFSTLRYLTVAGMFSLPEYGGNRDLIGYQLIGYQNQGGWAPPYSFYDADFMEWGE